MPGQPPDQPQGRKPTIDERLDRLTERHVALSQTVEILVGAQESSNSRIDKLAEKVDTVVDAIAALTADVHRISGDVDKLLIIATIQNERIKRLEDKSAA